MQNLKKEHMATGTHILHYLKGSPGQRLLMTSDSDLQTIAYYDSYWAGHVLSQGIS